MLYASRCRLLQPLGVLMALFIDTADSPLRISVLSSRNIPLFSTVNPLFSTGNMHIMKNEKLQQFCTNEIYQDYKMTILSVRQSISPAPLFSWLTLEQSCRFCRIGSRLISFHRTLKELLISESTDLNSILPSRPIFNPKFDTMIDSLLFCFRARKKTTG